MDFGENIPPEIPVRVPAVKPRSVSQFGRDLDIIESPPPAGSGSSTPASPFDLSFTPSSPGNITPIMVPGTINSVIPSNYLSLSDIADTGTFFFILSVTTLNGQIATASVSLAGSAPAGIGTTMGVPPTAFDFLIGVVQDGVWFRTAPTGSFTATPIEAFRASITNPAPGTLPYDIYYTWTVA